ncbi:DNA/RNA helicase, superfamily I domain protein [Mycobacterium xenopi 4042]|uniref:DNA/RNA helicase, superfamily I domain protein n=1 Tax=Mycobacterium xenopi 4042 TaxID=1299334 RepID=X7YJ78_MYCXE|nr:DNA/RNA helicase, superfamily I domain protein [Mycobacterium xenopi 4042]
MSRLACATADGYCSGLISDALAHSISPARSRTSSVLGCSPARFAARATTANLLSSSCQPGLRPPAARNIAAGDARPRETSRPAPSRPWHRSGGGVQCAQPRAHLAGRALGERHRQHLPAAT